MTHVGHVNPFRYRSYYYDKETELYYLNARYYNSKWGRFINADEYIGTNEDLLSQNLYLYSCNNFIGKLDKTGESSIAIPGGWQDVYNAVSGVSQSLGQLGIIGLAAGAILGVLLLFADAIVKGIEHDKAKAKERESVDTKPQTTYRRAYTTHRSPALNICNQVIDVSIASQERDKEAIKKGIELEKCIDKYDTPSNVGFYTKDGKSALLLAMTMGNDVVMHRAHGFGYFEHYHVNDNKSIMKVHIWYGEPVY